MTPSPEGTGAEDRRTLSDHDRARLRITYRLLLLGPTLGVVAAAALGLSGAGGAVGLAILLVLTAAGCVVTALVTAALAIVDEARRVPVSRRRTLTALAAFLGGFLLLLLSTGVTATI